MSGSELVTPSRGGLEASKPRASGVESPVKGR